CALAFSFNASATNSLVNQAMRQIAYANTSDTPPASVQIDWTFNDGNSGAQGVGGALTANGSTTVTITATNDAPVASNDAASGYENDDISGNVLTNDSDVDSVSITASLVSGPAHGSLALNPDGSFTYTPPASFQALGAGESDTVTFDFVANDGAGDSAPATVTITVTGTNDGPSISNGGAAFSIDENNAPNDAVGNVAASDPDTTDTLSYNIVGGTGAGLFSIDANGDITADSALDYEAASSYTLDVLVTDGNGGSATASYTVNVGDVNDNAPEISNAGDPIELTVTENTTGTVLDIDSSDADTVGSGPVYSLTGTDAGAFLINSSTGEVSFNPTADFENPTDTGADNVYEATVEVFDGANTTTRDIRITVADADEFDATAISDSDSASNEVAENAAGGTTVGITASSDDADGTDTITYSLDDDASGRFAINATTGVVSVAGPIDREDAASYDITVRATSTDGSFTTQNYTIAVTDVDEFDVTAPTDTDASANSIAENATAGATTGITVSSADADATNNTVTYSTSDARFEVNGTGELVVASGASFDFETESSISVTVTATSTDGSSASNDFTIAVTDVDDESPVLDTTALTADENQTAAGTITATDPDTSSAALTYTLVAGVGADDNAKFTLAPDGTLTFVSAPDFENPDDGDTNGVYSIRVSVSDGTNPATEGVITVTLYDVNEDPTITSSNAFNVDENTTSVATLTSSDPDAVGSALWAITGGDDADKFAINLTTGALEFKAGQDFENPADTGTDNVYEVEVTVFDGEGGQATQTISVTVTDVNEAPTDIALTNVATLDENSIYTPGAGNGVKVADIVITDDATGTNDVTLSGTDAADFEVRGSELYFIGASPDFEAQSSYEVLVSVNDATATPAGGDSELFTLVINDVNEAPVGNDDAASVTEDTDVTASGNVLTNDTDVDGDPLSVTTTGTFDGTYGRLTLNADGSWSYTLGVTAAQASAVDALGDSAVDTDTFNYTLSDGALDDNADLVITVNGSNDAPTATSLTGAANEDDTPAVQTFDLLASASDVDGGTLSAANLAQVSGPAVTASINGSNELEVDTSSALLQGLAAGETVDLVYTYDISDTFTTTSNQIVVTITGTNDDPQGAAAINAAGTENGSAVVVDLLQGVTDADLSDDLTITGLSSTSGRTLSFSETDGVLTLDMSGFDDLATGATEPVVFNYTVSDGNGGLLPRTLTVTVTGINDAPVATAATLTSPATEDSAYSFDVSTLFTDADSPETLSYTISGLPAGLALAGSTLSGTPTDADVGSFSVSITATDLQGASVTRAFTLVVDEVNDAPVLTADTGAVSEDAGGGSTTTGNLLANDNDGDANATQDLDVTEVDGNLPVSGTITVTDVDGTLTVDAETGAFTYAVDNGSTTVQALGVGETLVKVFNYTAADDGTPSQSSSSTLTITIHGTNDQPVAVADTASVTEDTATVANGNVLTDGTADSDIDGDALTVTTTGVQAGTYGSVTIAANGDYTYALSNGSSAVQALGVGDTLTDTFSYSISDGHGGTASATLTVTINGNPDAPTIAMTNALDAYTSGDADTAIADSAVIADAENEIVQLTFTLSVVQPDQTVDSALDTGEGLLVFGGNAAFEAYIESLMDVTITNTGDTVTIVANGAPLTTSQAQTLFDAITYQDPDQSFGFNANDREISVTVTDSDGLVSTAATATIDMAANVTDESGASGLDVFEGANRDDTISGADGDDDITGNGGDDTIDGGSGTDTAHYSSARAEYTVDFSTTPLVLSGGTINVVTGFSQVDHTGGSGADGTDSLSDVEILEFSDQIIDVSQNIHVYDSTGTLRGTFETIQDA
ncbi:MAG: VCBS domain-containing protein, partial [Ilumatobacter sp.]|nr:VCBS domain-containing protein [Ilumatobacter sp.]